MALTFNASAQVQEMVTLLEGKLATYEADALAIIDRSALGNNEKVATLAELSEVKTKVVEVLVKVVEIVEISKFCRLSRTTDFILPISARDAESANDAQTLGTKFTPS